MFWFHNVQLSVILFLLEEMSMFTWSVASKDYNQVPLAQRYPCVLASLAGTSDGNIIPSSKMGKCSIILSKL